MESNIHEYFSNNIKRMSKILIASLTLLISQVGFSQSQTELDKVKVEAFSIEVTIDSVEELESTFKEQDLEELFKISNDNVDITFKLNCSFEETKDKVKGSMTYTVKGKTNEKENFLKGIKKVKATALKFYNLKNRK